MYWVLLAHVLAAFGGLFLAWYTTRKKRPTTLPEGSDLIHYCASLLKKSTYAIFHEAYEADGRHRVHADAAHDDFISMHTVPVFVTTHAQRLVNNEIHRFPA